MNTIVTLLPLIKVEGIEEKISVCELKERVKELHRQVLLLERGLNKDRKNTPNPQKTTYTLTF